MKIPFRNTPLYICGRSCTSE